MVLGAGGGVFEERLRAQLFQNQGICRKTTSWGHVLH